MDADMLEIVEVIESTSLINRWRSVYSTDDAWPQANFSLPEDASRSYSDVIDLVDSPPPWNIAFSKRFQRDLDGLDRKLTGRVLEVLLEIKDFALPFVAKGDTFKALTGDLVGCWRYRIGDRRLVLRPNREAKQIAAMAFAARGSVYE